MNLTLREKSVIITGASSGIGQALANQLAAEGAYLTLAARSPQPLEAVAEACRQAGSEAIARPTDVADESQCRDLIQKALDRFGRVDMLINNAGIDVVSKLADLPDLRLFRQVIDVNFYGAVHCTYHALPALKETQGRIVNISSLGGLQAIPYNTSYVASKFALNGFSDSLRMEVEAEGISVTVICPSFVVTKFHEAMLDKDGMAKGPSGRAIYTEGTMSADQCARIVLKAARQRKRQVVMPPGPMALWLKLIAPSMLDRLTISRILRPAARRIQKG